MNTLEERLLAILGEYVSAIVARSVLNLSQERSHADLNRLESPAREKFLVELKKGISVFIKEPEARTRCTIALEQALTARGSKPAREQGHVIVEVATDGDVLVARNKGWYLCQEVEFPSNLKVTLVTVITELARNIVQYAGKGKIDISVSSVAPAYVQVVASDSGPGIKDLSGILSGNYKSSSGLGLGLKGVKRLMDECEIRTGPGTGTTVTAKKFVR